MTDYNPLYTKADVPDNINLTWNTISQMSDSEFEIYLKDLRKYILDLYKIDKNPIMMGQKSLGDIKKSLISFCSLDPTETCIELPVTDEYKKYRITDSQTHIKILKNYNKFGNVVNHWFPEMSETKVARNLKDKNPRSVMDNIEDWDFFKRNMAAVLKKDRMRIFKDKQNEPVFPGIGVALKLGSGTQPVTNFPPSIAKWLYYYWMNQLTVEGETCYILDPSMGWGGRMIGVLGASTQLKRQVILVGTDVNTNTHNRFDMIHRYWANEIYNVTDKRFYNLDLLKLYKYVDPAEDLHKNAEFKSFYGKGHLAFTSPPYFNRENYSDDDTQSFIRYGDNYDSWRDNFLYKMVENAYHFLKPGGILIINIADIKIGKDKYYPLEQDTIDAAVKNLGMKYIDKYYFLLSPIIGNNTAKNFITIKEEVESHVVTQDFFQSKPEATVKKPMKEMTYKFEPMFVFQK